MCGTPQRSRTTRTGADRPGTSCVPETSATRGGADGRSPRHATAKDAHAARSAKTAYTLATRRALRSLPSLRPSRSRLRAMALMHGLLADYDHEMGTTRKLLDRL